MADKERMYQHGVWIHLDSETYRELKSTQEILGMDTEGNTVKRLIRIFIEGNC